MDDLLQYTASVFIFDFERDESTYKGYTVSAFNQHEAGEKAIKLLEKEYENKCYEINHMSVNLIKDNKIKINNQVQVEEDLLEEVES